MHRNRWLAIGALAAATLALPGCGPAAPNASAETEVSAAQVVPQKGSDVSRLILSEQAIARLDIRTEPVRATAAAGRGSTAVTAVPYAAVLYDENGGTWVYVNPSPRTYIRTRIVIDRVVGDSAVLRAGPVAGTRVVTVGAPELLGTETGVAGES